MTIDRYGQPGLLHLVRDHLRVDAVLLSKISTNPQKVHNLVLTNHAEDIECLTTQRFQNDGLGIIISRQMPLAVPSLANNTFGMTSPLMEAEGLDAFLGYPLFQDEKCVGALQIMSKESRNWNGEDVAKLKRYMPILEDLHNDVAFSLLA